MDFKVVIESEVKLELRNIIYYIKSESGNNAAKLKTEILGTFKELAKNPERYPLDRFKFENDGSYRAYEIYHLRITYQISEFQIRILRIRHTKRNPLGY
jgi:plasmid stabilization system protein ParE